LLISISWKSWWNSCIFDSWTILCLINLRYSYMYCSLPYDQPNKNRSGFNYRHYKKNRNKILVLLFYNQSYFPLRDRSMMAIRCWFVIVWDSSMSHEMMDTSRTLSSSNLLFNLTLIAQKNTSKWSKLRHFPASL
jgi:hypothetical protein